MLVGEVRCATVGDRDLLEVVGRKPMVRGAHERLEVAPRLPRDHAAAAAGPPSIEPLARRLRPGGSASRRRPVRASQRVRIGSATGSAAGRAPVTMTSTTTRRSAGWPPSRRRRGRMSLRATEPAARAAAAAAVSHSSRRRWVNDQPHERQHDGVHHLVGVVRQERQLTAAPAPRPSGMSSRTMRRKTRRTAAAVADRTAGAGDADRSGTPGPPRIAARPHPAGCPGSTSHPADQREHACAGATRVRRRLSRIFQREMSGRRLRSRPWRVGHQGEQPEEDLPVAPGPAVLPPRMGEHARGIVVHHLDVGDEGRPGVQALEQVVREQRVLGHAPLERRHERVDVVEALAGEDPLAEQVLVGVRHGGGVGIDAGVPGVDAREERPGRARHRDADPGLEDAVAIGDAPQARDRSAGD